MSGKRVAILGGGISGLAAAYFLNEWSRQKQIPLEITLIEASSRLGGMIQTERRDGFVLESGPDMFLNEKPFMRGLCQRLGIEEELIETCEAFRRSFIYSGGRLYSVPDGFCLIAPSKIRALFDLSFVSFWGKLRMGLEYFIPSRKKSGDESVAAFMRRRFGREAQEKIGQPMFGGIYTGDTEKLSFQATMARFWDMERESGSVMRALFKQNRTEINQASGPRYGLFQSFRNGMQTLVNSLIAHMPDVRFLTSTPVFKIEKENSWILFSQNGSKIKADDLILALPGARAAELLEPLSGELSRELYSIPYESAVTVNMAYSKSSLKNIPEGFGFVCQAGSKLIGCTFSSVKFDGRAPEGAFLLRAFLGGAFHREIISFDDGEISRIVQSELRDILGIEGAPIFISIKRHLNAMPQYHIGHIERVGRIERLIKNIPGLFYASNALHGVGIPDTIEWAQRVTHQLMDSLSGTRQEEAIKC